MDVLTVSCAFVYVQQNFCNGGNIEAASLAIFTSPSLNWMSGKIFPWQQEFLETMKKSRHVQGERKYL